jgi:hypothetical protein
LDLETDQGFFVYGDVAQMVEDYMTRNIENVTKLISEGKSIREIAKIFNITETPMRKWLIKNKLKTNNKSSRRSWSDEELISIVKSSNTMADVLRKLKLSIRPGNYENIKIHIKRLNVDTSHFIGKSHGKSISNTTRSIDKILVKNSIIWNSTKKRLLKLGIINNECDICGITTWKDKPLVMVLDHINGDHSDCRKENLRMLCPNCNSQQSTFCRKRKMS